MAAVLAAPLPRPVPVAPTAVMGTLLHTAEAQVAARGHEAAQLTGAVARVAGLQDAGEDAALVGVADASVCAATVTVTR